MATFEALHGFGPASAFPRNYLSRMHYRLHDPVPASAFPQKCYTTEVTPDKDYVYEGNEGNKRFRLCGGGKRVTVITGITRVTEGTSMTGVTGVTGGRQQ